MDWLDEVLGLSQQDLEWYQMVSRAIVVYVVAMLYVRMAGMRTFGTTSAFDVVVTITIGAVLSQAVTGHRPFFSCLCAGGGLALCHRLIALVMFKFTGLRRLIVGKPVLLFENGQLLENRLSAHSIHPSEVDRQLREQGIDDYNKVKQIWYETDGKISVVKKG